MHRTQMLRPIGLVFTRGCPEYLSGQNKISWKSRFRKAWKRCVEDLAGRDMGGVVLRGCFNTRGRQWEESLVRILVRAFPFLP